MKKLFKKGEGGRKKGSKNKRTIEIEELRRVFINALYHDEKTFREAVNIALKKNPVDVLRVVASVLPKDVNMTGNAVIPIQLIDPEEKNV